MAGNNSSTDGILYNDGTPEFNILYAIVLSSLTILTIILNFGIIIAFWKDLSLREKPSDLLILSLSVADFFQGLIFLPFLTHLHSKGYWIFGETFCRLWVAYATLTGITSAMLLLAICWDRVLLITVPYPRYMKTQTKLRIKITIALCWILSLVPTLTELGLWDYAKRVHPLAASIDFDVACLAPARRLAIFQIFLIIFNIIPCVIVGILSCIFLHHLRRKIQKSNRISDKPSASINTLKPDASESTGSSAQPESVAGNSNQRSDTLQSRDDRGVKNRYIKPAVTLFALVLAMVICVVPYNTYVIIVIRVCSKCYKPELVSSLSVILFCNPLFDAMFYGMTQGKIRRFYKTRIRSFCREVRHR